MKEVNCFTNRPAPFFVTVKDSLYPTALLGTNRVNFDERTNTETLTFDPDVTIESRGYVDLKAFIRGRDDFIRDGLSYQRWIDREGQVRHWHVTMNPNLDPETYKFFKSIADCLDPETKKAYISHVNMQIPIFKLNHAEGIVYDFGDGRQLVGQGDAVLFNCPDGIPRGTDDYKGKSFQAALRSEIFVPRRVGVHPNDVEVIAGVRFPQTDLYGVEREIDRKMRSGNVREDFVRGLINPYFYVKRKIL